MSRKKKTTIHTRIADLRGKAKLTQTELAKKVGVGKSAVWHWENGDSAPTGKRLPLVADVLGVSIDELIRGES